MKYSHNYNKLKKKEYTTIRRYPKGKVGKRVMEIYPGGMHPSKIIEVKRIILAFTDLSILQLDTDLEKTQIKSRTALMAALIKEGGKTQGDGGGR